MVPALIFSDCEMEAEKQSRRCLCHSLDVKRPERTAGHPDTDDSRQCHFDVPTSCSCLHSGTPNSHSGLVWATVHCTLPPGKVSVLSWQVFWLPGTLACMRSSRAGPLDLRDPAALATQTGSNPFRSPSLPQPSTAGEGEALPSAWRPLSG